MPIQETIRLNVSEAAKLFGVAPATIRQAIREQALKYVVVRGRYKIGFESLLEWSQKRIKIKNKLAKQGIGQFVEQWKIKNKLFSPNPASLQNQQADSAAQEK